MTPNTANPDNAKSDIADSGSATIVSRRAMLRGAAGLGAMGLSGGLSSIARANEGQWRGVLQRTHFAPRAKRIIWLYMAGGPSHVDLLDPKPELNARDGEVMPASLTDGQQLAQLQGQELICSAAQYPFKHYGESGTEMSTLLPHIGENLADKICVVRSMVTEQINHDPAHTFMNTGALIAGRPSMGAWVDYGLGSSNDDLPGFVVLTSVGGGGAQPIAGRQWSNGFLPGRFQGVEFGTGPEPIPYLSRPGTHSTREAQLIDAVNRLNALKSAQTGDPEAGTRNLQYQMALRMQRSVPELTDFSQEPDHITSMYGLETATTDFARNCLMARRLAERGTRFIQVYHRGWDHHNDIGNALPRSCSEVDQATAALVLDLEQRGLLEDTLVVWGGEFGRTPMAQSSGRDHHIKAFSLWMAGAGIKPGTVYGATDDFGYGVVEDKMHVHDLHATILHQLGIDHEKLTYRFQGRDFRLTDVHGHVANKILA